MTFEFHSEAETEFLEAIAYYEECEPELGEVHACRVCQAWYRASEVKIVAPGISGAEGSEKGKAERSVSYPGRSAKRHGISRARRPRDRGPRGFAEVLSDAHVHDRDGPAHRGIRLQDGLRFSPAYSIVIAVSVWALFHMGLFPRDFLLIARKSISMFM